MPLSWNEITQRALRFSDTWKRESRESAERQTFWNEFFEVSGVNRRAVERCCRKEPFPNDRARVEFLFQQYETLTAPLVPTPKTRRGKKAKT